MFSNDFFWSYENCAWEFPQNPFFLEDSSHKER